MLGARPVKNALREYARKHLKVIINIVIVVQSVEIQAKN